MLDITKDIQSLTSFRRNSGEFIRRLRKSKRPLVLTVRGKAQAVVQDAEAYQRLLDTAARADVYEAIRQGLDDICARRTQALAEACFSETLDFGTPPGVTKSRSRGSENPLLSDPESTSLAVAPTLRIRHRPFRNGLSSNWLG